MFTGDAGLAERMRSVRVHGQGSDKYDNVRIGVNGRLDTMQAAILLEKLAIFAEEIETRNRIAARYNEALADVARVPEVIEGGVSAWAQYTIQVADRDRVAAHLKSQGIPTAVYYPIPLSRQTGYREYPTVPGGIPVSEDLSAKVISLPFHPYLEEDAQQRIITAVREALGG